MNNNYEGDDVVFPYLKLINNNNIEEFIEFRDNNHLNSQKDVIKQNSVFWLFEDIDGDLIGVIVANLFTFQFVYVVEEDEEGEPTNEEV